MPANQTSGSDDSLGAADDCWLRSRIMVSGAGRMPVGASELKHCRNQEDRAPSWQLDRRSPTWRIENSHVRRRAGGQRYAEIGRLRLLVSSSPSTGCPLG